MCAASAQNKTDVGHSRRLVLTHLDPEVYAASLAETGQRFLPELIVYALLYGQVLVKDADIVVNQRITEFLQDQSSFNIFEELLDVGVIKILTLPRRNYPPQMDIDPSVNPIVARAHDISSRKGYQGQIWTPTERQMRFYTQVDAVLSRSTSGAISSQGFAVDCNPFAEKLAEILEKRKSLRLEKFRQFRGIDERVAESFITFSRIEGSWIEFLSQQGAPPQRTGEPGRFYRNEAYQCLKHFPKTSHRGMRNLIQSVFAACYCDSEDAYSRYGGPRLVEIPFGYSSDAEVLIAEQKARKVELIPTQQTLDVPIFRGIGEALNVTRNTTEFAECQRAISSIEAGSVSQAVFAGAWEEVANRFAETVAPKLAVVPTIEKWMWHLVPSIVVETGRAIGLHLNDVASRGAEVISHCGPALSRFCRSLVLTAELRDALVGSVNVRCSKVDLSLPSK